MERGCGSYFTRQDLIERYRGEVAGMRTDIDFVESKIAELGGNVQRDAA